MASSHVVAYERVVGGRAVLQCDRLVMVLPGGLHVQANVHVPANVDLPAHVGC